MGCTVYLVRHGPAEVVSATVSEEERGLTPQGRETITRAAAGLQRLDVTPQVILASPLARAQETAEILSSTIASGVTVEGASVLAPGNQLSAIVDELGNHREVNEIVLVGHQPTMGELASALLSGWPGLVAFPFKAGAVAAIDLVSLPPERQGSLRWFVTAGQLGAIGVH